MKDDDPEVKWLEVKEFYERNYKVKFKKKLSEDKINFLYIQMVKLSHSVAAYLNSASRYVKELCADPDLPPPRGQIPPHLK